MIFKAFQGQGLDWKSYIGVGGKSFRQHEESTSLGYNILPSFITDKIVTKRNIQGQLKDLSVYDNFKASDLLNEIHTVDSAVQNGQAHWSDYFNAMNKKPGMEWVKDFIQSNDVAEMGLDDVIAAQETARLGAVNYNNALKSTLTTTKLMGAAMKVASIAGNMLIGAGISLAVEAAIKGIDNLIHHSEKLIEAGKQADENISNAISSYQEKVSSIQDLGKQVADNPNYIKTTSTAIDNLAQKYSKFKAGVNSDGSNLSLSSDEYKEFLDVSNQLADLFPSLKVGIDGQGNALLSLGANAVTTADQLKDLIEVQKTLTHTEITGNLTDSYLGMREQVKDYDNKIKVLKEKEKTYSQYQVNANEDMSSFEQDAITDLQNGYLKVENLTIDKENAIREALAKSLNIGKGNADEVNSTSTWEDGNYIVTFHVDPVDADKAVETAKSISAYLTENTQDLTNKAIESTAEKKALEAQKKQAITDFANNSVVPYLQTSAAISDINSDLMNALTANAKNFDYSSIESEYSGDVDAMLRQKIIVPLQGLESDAQTALKNALTLDPDELSIDDYVDKLNNYLSKVSNDKDTQDMWKKTFGIDNIENDAKDQVNAIANVLKSVKKSDIKSLSGEDRNKLYNQVLNDPDSLLKADKEYWEKKKELAQNYNTEVAKITSESYGLGDYKDRIMNQTGSMQFGNIDMDNRAIITWSKKLKDKFKTELASWDYNPEIGGIDTVFGGSGRFGEDILKDGVEVAFSPIMQVDGKAKFLNKQTVTDYIEDLVKDATDASGNFSEDKLLELDKNGRKIGDTFVQGIIAGADTSLNYSNNGNTAEVTGKLMHFMGKYGSMQLASMSLDQFNELDEILKEIQGDAEELNGIDLSTFATNATKHINAISNITSALSESKSGTGLSLAAEVDDETGAVSLSGSLKNLQDIYMDLKDEAGEPLFKNSFELSETLFEKTANGIHVNKEALQELQDLEEKQTKADFLEQEKTLREQINQELAKQKELETGSDEYNTSEQNLQNLYNQLDTVQNLASAYDGATSAYNKWIQAQSGGNERDNYENIAKGYDSAKAAIEQGWYGDDSLNKYLDMMLSKDKRTGDAKKDFSQLTKKIKGTNHSLMDYWRYDKDDNLVTDGLFDFLDDAKKTLGDAFVQIDEDGAYSFDFTGDKLQQVADYFHTTTDVVEMFSKALIDAGATVKMEDNDTSLDGIAQKLKEASEAADKSRDTLEKLKQSGDITTTIDFNADVSSMDTDAIDNRITELQNLKNKLEVKFGIDSSEVSAVDDLLEEANARKQQLELESKCNVTVDINGDEDLEELKTKLADLPENENSNVTVSVHNEDQMDSVIQEIQQVPDNTPVTFSFNVDNQDQADALQAKIDKLQSEDSNKTFKYSIQVTDESKDVGKGNDSIINVEAKPKGKEKVDELKSSIEALKDKNVNVRAKVDKGQLDGLSAQLAGLKDKNINITTTTTNVTVPSSTGSPYAQPASLSGNKGKPKKKRATGSFAVAHASGTAYNVQNYKRLTPAHAAGDVSLKQNETALVNEEYLNGHSESIVRDGVWSLIPGGAHVENLKRGDIIFSAKQTDDLLRTGATPGHARAYANGTVDISGAYGASGVNGKRRKKSGKSTSKTSKNSSSSKSKSKSTSSDKSTTANTKATDSNTQATEDNTDAQENLQDWISRLCDVSKDWNDSFKNAIDQFEMNYNQNKAIDEYVANSESYKNTLRNSANNYMSRANSLGLSGDYIHKIWTGTMDIENITDENVRDKIEKYTEWYDKARDLNSEIADLNKSIRETKIQKLDNIKDDYDNLVSLSTSISDYNESVSDLSEKLTGVGDANALLRSANAQVAIRQALVNSEAQLNAQLNALVADGTIGMYTDTWNKWQEEINGVKKSIIEADEALNDLKKSIIEVRFNSFTKAIDKLDFKSDMSSAIQDLLLEEGIYDDDVKITSTGYTKLGLLGTDLVNAKQKVADYSEAIRALKENYKQGNISQADFNEQLQEYQKDQMDAVSATKTARDAIIDLIKDGIEKETDAMDELISKRKDDLDKQKEYYDFQKKMNDQSKDMNKVRAQLAALEGDDSLEATAKRRKLESQLKDLQEQYDEDQKDHEKDVVSDAYDKTLEDFKKNQEDTVKELESSLEKQNQAISNALEATKNNYNDVYTILTELSNQYNFSLTQDLVSPWQSAQAALQQYQDAIGKLNANISSIDTSKITTAQPSQASTVPTKNESTYITKKSQNGTWLDQDGRWWYQHNDGGWKNDGWESIDGQWYKFDREGWMQTGWQPWGTDSTGNAAWYYLTDSGAMARSTWVAGANGAQYYVDSTGVMARNGYVRSADGSKYYWVNADGVWEPSWTTTAPNLNKYKLYYSTGTPKAKNELAYMDDMDGKLNLGSEAMITEKGILGNWGGNVIFSKEQTQALYNMSNGIFPGMDQMIKNVKANTAPVNITNNVSQGDINLNFGSAVNVEGDWNKNVDMNKFVKQAVSDVLSELKTHYGRLK